MHIYIFMHIYICIHISHKHEMFDGIWYSTCRFENCVFPALRCGPAGQGVAPGNTMIHGFDRCVSGTIIMCLMVALGSEDTPAGA